MTETNPRLKSYVDRIERLEAEKAVLKEDINEVYAEAKSAGFDVKVLRKLIADRRKDPQQLSEEEELLAIYKEALGE